MDAVLLRTNKHACRSLPTLHRYGTRQAVDVFGELAGISFSPDGERLFVGVSDVHYSSLLQFDRRRDRAALLAGWL